MKTGRVPKFLLLMLLPMAAFAVLAGSYLHVADPYELETLDLRFRLRPPIPVTDKAVIVEIGDDTIARLGRFPFDRSYHTLLVKALSDAGAKAIVFDLFFSEEAASDAGFADAVAKAGNVYLPLAFELKQRSRGPPESAAYAAKNLDSLNRAARGTGHINVVPDLDGKYRRVPAFIRHEGALYPYLALKVACDSLGIPLDDSRIEPGRRAGIGRGIDVPLDENSLILVNYSGPWGASYGHYSYADILQSYLAKLGGGRPNIDLSVFKGKACFIGLTAVGTVDLHPNPFDTLYPAVGMHAEVFNSVVNKAFMRRAPRWANMAVLLFLMALVSALVLRTKPRRALFILFSVVSIYALGAAIVFNRWGIWLDIIYPALVIVLLYLSLTLYKYVREWKHRLLIENELDIARKIQESFLPGSAPSIEGVEVAARIYTARQVGGDLYDFVTFGHGSRKFGVMIGDVSGKGVPAALFMAMAVGAFRSFASAGTAAEKVLEGLNRKLSRESASNLFVTMFYMIFDAAAGSASFGSAGHLPVLKLGAAGRAQFLDVSQGAPLGLIEGEYSGGEVGFERGDTFIFYTDGITEAMDQKSEMYGKERLEAVAVKNRLLGASGIADAIEKDVRKFEPKSRQHDDMTVIVVKIGKG
jgi:CHASE2 domain-containing sensor protein